MARNIPPGMEAGQRDAHKLPAGAHSHKSAGQGSCRSADAARRPRPVSFMRQLERRRVQSQLIGNSLFSPDG